jgi:hypothetical protein
MIKTKKNLSFIENSFIIIKLILIIIAMGCSFDIKTKDILSSLSNT